MDTTVNQQFGKQAFDQAEKLFKDARVPENVQAMAQQGVAASKDFYAKTAAAAQDGAKVMTEIADTAWGSTKMLNEKIVQNLTANAEAAFTAAQAMATAKSLPEARQAAERVRQRLAAQASEQTKEFFDLSTRATQHLFEKAQAAASQVVQAHVLNSNPSTTVETATALVAVFCFTPTAGPVRAGEIRLACARVPQKQCVGVLRAILGCSDGKCSITQRSEPLSNESGVEGVSWTDRLALPQNTILDGATASTRVVGVGQVSASPTRPRTSTSAPWSPSRNTTPSTSATATPP